MTTGCWIIQLYNVSPQIDSIYRAIPPLKKQLDRRESISKSGNYAAVLSSWFSITIETRKVGNILSFLSALCGSGKHNCQNGEFKHKSGRGRREERGGDGKEKISDRKNDKGLVNYAL